MLKSDQNDVLQNEVSDDFQYIDYDKCFSEFVIKFIVTPFGKPLNQDLMELFSQQKLDLSETLIKELKATVQIDGGRKSLRKP
jgi:hypothetical protein